MQAFENRNSGSAGLDSLSLGPRTGPTGRFHLKRQILFLLLVIVTIGVAAPASASTMTSPTFAYIDPATGTLILSAIVGGFAAIGMFIKKFWYRIKAMFTGGKAKPVLVDADQDTTSRGSDNPTAPE